MKTRVTIGLPVFNGAMYLNGALESLLSQEFTDFELWISDNASTDATSTICESFATRDPRVRYIRQADNIGAVSNFELVLHRAHTKYFMWAAHDDLWDPSFVSDCVAALDANGDAVVACPRFRIIDDEGGSIPFSRGRIANAEWTGRSAAGRIRNVAMAGAVPFYGLFRTEALRRALPLGRELGSDLLCMLKLAHHGPFVSIPKVLFAYRLTTPKAVAAHADPARTREGFTARTMPHAALFGDMVRTAWQLPTALHHRLAYVIAVGLGVLSGPQWLRQSIAMDARSERDRSLRRGDRIGLWRARFWGLLGLPDKLSEQRTKATDRFVDAVQNRRRSEIVLRLPAYLLAHPGAVLQWTRWRRAIGWFGRPRHQAGS